MKKASSKPYISPDIKLKSPPLAEAWLEIRWQLQHVGPPQLMRDPGFPFALGVFYKSIKDRFEHKEDLAASQAPLEMLPHVVRHRFRASKDGYPLLQLGPGVASVNFTEPYNWKDFRETALYLRDKLSDAYSETVLMSDILILRYRNVEPFEYSSDDLLRFVKKNLNTSLALPTHIPGYAGSKDIPTSANIVLTFDLIEPKGVGTLKIATGTRRQSDPETGQQTETEVLVSQLEVASGGNDAPKINNEGEFVNWFDAAHDIIHDWFFSLIEGPLLKKYKGEGK